MNEDVSYIKGILWMLLTTIFFVLVTAIVKYIGSDIPSAQAAFIRYVIGTLILFPFIVPIINKNFGKQNIIIFSLRGLAHGLAVMLWFYAISRIPIAEVTAISYTAPIFISIGAAIFFGEKFASRRIIAIIFAFVGTLIILRPGFNQISTGQIAQILTAPLFAISFLLTKKLSETMSSIVIVCMLSVYVTLILMPAAIIVWVHPAINDIIGLSIVAILATLGHLTLTQAIKTAPLTFTQPISYLQLIWATLIGFYFFSEKIDLFVLMGGGIIISSVTYISFREIKLNSFHKTTLSNYTKN